MSKAKKLKLELERKLMFPITTEPDPHTVANTDTKSVISTASGIVSCIVQIENGCTVLQTIQ